MGNCMKPLKLHSNRVWRTYIGGEKLEQWLGLSEQNDGHFPEEWVASVIVARNPGREHILDEGLSHCEVDRGDRELLKNLIDGDPVLYLGEKHVMKYGSNPAVLIKLLDAAERLTIQVHPNSDTAKRLFDSDFGKTEAWYIIGGRVINGEPPYVLLGFKPGITKEIWRKLFEKQDIEGMIDRLHKFYVEPGQVYLIEGGTPHAIGPGCFLVEVQEPTDYTIRVERHTPAGDEVPDSLCHQGIGFENIFECFHYDACTRDEIIKKWCIYPTVLHDSDDTYERMLIGPKETTKFCMNSIEVKGSYAQESTGAFSVYVVVSGGGRLCWQGGEDSVNQGDTLFIPAGLKKFKFINNSPHHLQLIRCFHCL